MFAGIVSGRRNRVRSFPRTTSTRTVTTNGGTVTTQSVSGGHNRAHVGGGDPRGIPTCTSADVATTNAGTVTSGAGTVLGRRNRVQTPSRTTSTHTATTNADTVTTGSGNGLTGNTSLGNPLSTTPSTYTVATNIVTVTTGSGSGLDRHIGVGTIPTTTTFTRPSTIGIVTGAEAGRSAEASVGGGLLPLSVSDGIGSGRQSEESLGLSHQPGSTVTTGNNTVPTTTTVTTITTTTTTVLGLPNTTSGTDEAMQDSDDDPLSIFRLDDVEMEERGRRWRATLPRETDTSNVDQVPVSRTATPNPVTSNDTIPRPPGTVWRVLCQNALVKVISKIYRVKAALISTTQQQLSIHNFRLTKVAVKDQSFN